MFGDPDNESVFDRLGDMLSDKLGFIAPIWIIRRPESLTIVDYRPTFLMLLSVSGFLGTAGLAIFLFVKIGRADWFGLWAIGFFAVACLLFSFRGTIREVYYFDQTTGSYSFIRQFIHRKEIIDGSMSQFTTAYVTTQENEESESYFVMLSKEGMFLTGVTEQTLREHVPIFNSFNNEARIANAISDFLS